MDEALELIDVDAEDPFWLVLWDYSEDGEMDVLLGSWLDVHKDAEELAGVDIEGAHY